MKFIAKTLKPRNPLALAARQRHAGSHRAGSGAMRREAGRELRREIERLRPSP